MILITSKKIKQGQVLAYPVGHLAITLVGRHRVAHLQSPQLPLGAEADGSVINSVVHALRRFADEIELSVKELRDP